MIDLDANTVRKCQNYFHIVFQNFDFEDAGCIILFSKIYIEILIRFHLVYSDYDGRRQKDSSVELIK